MNILDSALKYANLGFSIIPVGRDKKPLIRWEEFQRKKATEEEIKNWWQQFPEANIGIVTGKINGIVVLDIEAEADLDNFLKQYPLPHTPYCRTGGGGWHYYFKYPAESQISTKIGVLPKIDIKADGGYVIAPPSIHQSGNAYEWIVALEKLEDLADIPGYSILKNPKEISVKDWQSITNGVEEGKRNITTAEVAGKLLTHLPQKDWESFGWNMLYVWNLQNKPNPLSVKELRTVFESIASRESAKKEIQVIKKLLSADEILEMAPTKDLFLVEKLIPHKGITVLSGYPASGKSWLILYLAKAVASGENLFQKYPTIKGSVLIIDEEGGVDEFKRRMELMRFPRGMPIHFYSQQGLKVDNSWDLELLSQTIKKKDIKLIIFDPFSAIHSKTENSAEEMQKVMEFLQELTLAETSVLFAHHHRKELHWKTVNPSQSLRGSSVLFGRVDSHIVVEKKREDSLSVDLVLSQEKLRRGKKLTPFEIRLVESEGMMNLEYVGEHSEEKSKKEEVREFIVSFLKEKGQALREEILEAAQVEVGVKERTVSDVIRELEKEDIIKSPGKQGKKKIYCLDGEVENVEISISK